MSAEAAAVAPDNKAREARGCDCDKQRDVRRVVTPDGNVEVGHLCRRCRKLYWGVSS